MWRAGVVVLLVGCGGPSATANPAASAKAGTPPNSATDDDDDEVTAPMKAAVPPEELKNEIHADGSVMVANLFKVGETGFPQPVTSDAQCDKGLGFTGAAAHDYAELTGKCGTGTGMKEFVRAHTGLLDEKHPRETYAFKMLGGFCYRMFAVADDTVKGIKIRVQRPEGALLSMASSKGFVTILNPDGTWCKNKDREFRLIVESGGGAGKYTFGIWARPK